MSDFVFAVNPYDFSQYTSDIMGIIVRNESRSEAGQDPIEEIIEIHM